jgi:molybdopterin-binding protein
MIGSLHAVPAFRINDAARLLGVSDDTLRRWVDAGRLAAVDDDSGRRVVEGAELARFARERADGAVSLETGPIVQESARNRFTGVVTRVVKDTVMAQVELAAGPFRLVSLMSAEAATELGLEPGVLAVASVKSTNVVVEVPQQP